MPRPDKSSSKPLTWDLPMVRRMGKEQGWTEEQIADANAHLLSYTKIVWKIYRRRLDEEDQLREENRRRLKENRDL